MDTIFNGLSGWGKVGSPGAYRRTAASADDPQFVAVPSIAAPLRNVSPRSNSGALDECKQGYRRAVSAAGAFAAFAAFAIGIDGVASARVTSTVTNRASSQSAHFAAFFIRS
ncbi:MAG: hypothetical protein JSR28_16295, partial [Proteobacteria bacterium]|nr:hypothetical protein [Pseudomonadota bacterium]